MASSSDPSVHAPGVRFKDGKKMFIPLENNPEVFTGLVKTLGLSPALGFHDVFSLDEPELLALVPRPVHALIFIAPSPVDARIRESDPGPVRDYYLARQKDKSIPLTYDGSGPQEPVVWYKQTIGNACGLIALLHAVSNGTAREFVEPGSFLARLLAEVEDLKPMDRAAALYNSHELEEAHMAAAVTGDTEAPESLDPVGYHFYAFVRGKDGHLYELDGGTDGPVDRGFLESDNLLSDEALDRTVRRYISLADGILEFSVVALATNKVD